RDKLVTGVQTCALPILWDVIPLSLGIELADGSMERILHANEQIPVMVWRKGPQAFTTQRDGQERIRFRIFQGEYPMAAENTLIRSEERRVGKGCRCRRS